VESMTTLRTDSCTFEEMKNQVLNAMMNRGNDDNAILVGNIHCILKPFGDDITVLYASWSVG